jgi:uncharacterized protein YbjT (DUF2867 family)
MSQHQRVLVIGGTRGTGLLIARVLHQRGQPVRVLARDRARALTLFDSTVEVVAGDITRPETLPPAIDGARHVVFTAGCRSGHPARESHIKATEYDGLVNTLDAAQRVGFSGRFLYMTSSGLLTPSVAAFCLNLWKGNTLVWRRRVESEIRKRSVDYTIIRTGILLNRAGGRHMIRITQHPLPLSPRHRIARADVAEVFVRALEHARASRVTFEAVWGGRGQSDAWRGALDRLTPDSNPPLGCSQPASIVR